MEWTSQPNIAEGITLSIARNINKRKEAEKRLLEQKKQLMSMFDGIDDVIYVADPETCELLYINDVGRKIWGEDIVGKKCYTSLQGRDAPCPFCTNKEIFIKPGESYIWEFQNEITKRWYRCFDKTIKWTSGKLVRFEMAMDITEIMTVQKQIIKEKSVTESILESIPGIFYQLDAEGHFVRTNKNFQKLVGKTEEELKLMTAIEFFPENERELVANNIQKVFAEGNSNVEASVITKNGMVPFYLTGLLQTIDNIPYLIGVGSDITHIKEAETSLVKKNKELEVFNKMAIGREKCMIELKRKINSLSKELGLKEPYDLSFADKKI